MTVSNKSLVRDGGYVLMSGRLLLAQQSYWLEEEGIVEDSIVGLGGCETPVVSRDRSSALRATYDKLAVPSRWFREPVACPRLRPRMLRRPAPVARHGYGGRPLSSGGALPGTVGKRSAPEVGFWISWYVPASCLLRLAVQSVGAALISRLLPGGRVHGFVSSVYIAVVGDRAPKSSQTPGISGTAMAQLGLGMFQWRFQSFPVILKRNTSAAVSLYPGGPAAQKRRSRDGPGERSASASQKPHTLAKKVRVRGVFEALRQLFEMGYRVWETFHDDWWASLRRLCGGGNGIAVNCFARRDGLLLWW
ncbi:hypothetical protein EVAR_86546_1 [Eumeta japonica]|uniref:Uncharacterized protein n=1 Tax=Eumeta variegata TaxID=151549 RepID=A0A4C1ZKR2_EUMVA|nr:hypothetical protein EVAR_86546_1 [Eumeta japonica]